MFGRFGRSPELRAFDGALRSVDLHPSLVPEAVKLAAVNLLRDQCENDKPEPPLYRSAAEIVAYCMLGREAFAGANTAELATDVEKRIETALQEDTSLDAKLVLLTLHARVVQPSVVDEFQLESSSD